MKFNRSKIIQLENELSNPRNETIRQLLVRCGLPLTELGIAYYLVAKFGLRGFAGFEAAME